jgi:hypothetical protein
VNVLALVVRVREALEDGDITFAYDILTALEHDLAADQPEQLRTLACLRCSARFRRPGELDHHQRVTHFAEAA